jgi:hypothetical protein
MFTSAQSGEPAVASDEKNAGGHVCEGYMCRRARCGWTATRMLVMFLLLRVEKRSQQPDYQVDYIYSGPQKIPTISNFPAKLTHYHSK